MRFIHTADIHYGAQPDLGKTWSQERSDAIKSSLKKIVDAAEDNQADAVFICGDLFSSIPSDDEIKEADEVLSKTKAKVYIIPGEADHLTVSTPVLTFAWSSNIRYIPSANVANLKIGNTSVVLHYDSDSTGLPVNNEEIENAAYVALGGQHKALVLEDGKSVYPGSPEPLGPDETGEHGVYFGEIDEKAGKLTTLKFIPTAEVKYVSLVVDVTPDTTSEEVADCLRAEMKNRGDQNIYSVRIHGQRSPEAKFDINILKDDFRILKINDETEPKYDFQRLFEEHPADMLGFFVQKMNNENNSDMDKKALYFGVNALIQTADERK